MHALLINLKGMDCLSMMTRYMDFCFGFWLRCNMATKVVIAQRCDRIMAGLMHTLIPIHVHAVVASAGAFSEVSIHIHTLAHNKMK